MLFRSDATCIIAGDGPCRGEYESFVSFSGMRGRVTFAGVLAPSAVAELFSGASISVVPSRAEGFGIVAVEAMACGAVPVASRVGGLPDIVCDGVTGVLVPPEDPEALAGAITALWRDPARMNALRARAISEAAAYDWAAVSRRASVIFD